MDSLLAVIAHTKSKLIIYDLFNMILKSCNIAQN